MKSKLTRKLLSIANEGKAFDITAANFFERVTDAIGARLLHLSFAELEQIHPKLLELFEAGSVDLLEPPKAYTWDPAYRSRFESLGIETQENPRYYTSVHYVIAGNAQRTWSAEIQVRTLAEELWGEVDHKFNYPEPHVNEACRDQIAVLAAQVSAVSRLVDSIYRSASGHHVHEHEQG